jgi:mRNA interferase RelE/StbE
MHTESCIPVVKIRCNKNNLPFRRTRLTDSFGFCNWNQLQQWFVASGDYDIFSEQRTLYHLWKMTFCLGDVELFHTKSLLFNASRYMVMFFASRNIGDSSYYLLAIIVTDSYHAIMFMLRYHKQAQKVLAKMPRDISRRLRSELTVIAGNPSTYQGDWKPLSGTPFWRLRVGGWRAICEFRNNELILFVLKVGVRGDIY